MDMWNDFEVSNVSLAAAMLLLLLLVTLWLLISWVHEKPNENRCCPERDQLHGSYRRLLQGRGRRQGPRVAQDHV